MNPTDRVPALMHRTMVNLRFIEQHAAKDGPYEVTQLINSFLGALAHPWEEYKSELNRTSLREAINQGWPLVKKELKKDRDPKNLGDFLGLVRHSFAHGNIEFIPDRENEIEFIRFWNIDPSTKERTWGCKLSVADLRRFLERFVQLAKGLAAKREQRPG